jgi:hypothetical protein
MKLESVYGSEIPIAKTTISDVSHSPSDPSFSGVGDHPTLLYSLYDYCNASMPPL